MTKMVECVALRPIDSTLPSVGSRLKGEKFNCPDYIAQHLKDIQPPQVRITGEEAPRPKMQGASSAGPSTPPASSSRVAQASPQKKSNSSGSPARKKSAAS